MISQFLFLFSRLSNNFFLTIIAFLVNYFIFGLVISNISRKFRYKRGLAWPFSTSADNQTSKRKQLTKNMWLFLWPLPIKLAYVVFRIKSNLKLISYIAVVIL